MPSLDLKRKCPMFDILKRTPRRLWKSFGYLRDALITTFRKEESFRLEAIAFCIVVITLLVCSWPVWKKVAMIGSFLLIPLTETLNSAIEDVCNLVTRDHNLLVKNAKDKGALAVLFAIILNVLVLIALLLAFTATLFPSWQASRINPAEALRYE